MSPQEAILLLALIPWACALLIVAVAILLTPMPKSSPQEWQCSYPERCAQADCPFWRAGK